MTEGSLKKYLERILPSRMVTNSSSRSQVQEKSEVTFLEGIGSNHRYYKVTGEVFRNSSFNQDVLHN